MHELIRILSEKYGMVSKRDSFQETFEQDEFAVSSYDGSICEIYFKENHMKQILELMKEIRRLGNSLSEIKIREYEEKEFEQDYMDFSEYDE